jgi:hypothetical protein
LTESLNDWYEKEISPLGDDNIAASIRLLQEIKSGSTTSRHDSFSIITIFCCESAVIELATSIATNRIASTGHRYKAALHLMTISQCSIFPLVNVNHMKEVLLLPIGHLDDQGVLIRIIQLILHDQNLWQQCKAEVRNALTGLAKKLNTELPNALKSLAAAVKAANLIEEKLRTAIVERQARFEAVENDPNEA